MIDLRMYCAECGQPRMMTEMGAILCPAGHGRVLSNVDITRRQLKNAGRDMERHRWACQYPLAHRVNRVTFTIEGQAGHWRRVLPDAVEWGHALQENEIAEGEVVARLEDDRVFIFKPCRRTGSANPSRAERGDVTPAAG